MIRLFTFLTLFQLLQGNHLFAAPAITYDHVGGRFGDALLAYFHAKWISYKYGIPLIYKEYPYFNKLHMHINEIYLPSKRMKQIEVRNVHELEWALKRNMLIILPYFPESKWEQDHGSWPYILVDWEDPTFRKMLKENTRPIINLEPIQIPKNVLSVACHLRRGTNVDPECTLFDAALKFPHDNFFIAEIRWLMALFPDQPMYVHLFTDDPNPIEVKKEFEKIFHNYPSVTFGCRSEANFHNINVLEDFFGMTAFDCSIHGESNFSICAAKISDYLVECQAAEFHWENKTLIIDRTIRKIRKSKLTPYMVNANLLQDAIILE